jgi:hypothetical protein
MKTSQLLSLLSIGAALTLIPGAERFARADNDSHPVFGENPGKHKGWEKHDKHLKHDVAPIPPHRYEHVADARHEHLYPHTVTRTSTGYWHSHDGYPRHFHYYPTPVTVPPRQYVRREVVVVDNRSPVVRPVVRKDVKAIRDTRNEIKDDRDQLRKQHTELEKDRAELRRDIRSGASKTEISKDRKELRNDAAQIRKTQDELASDRARLETARRTVR